MFLKFAINLLALSLREIVPITSKDLQIDGPTSALSDLTAGFFFKTKTLLSLRFKWLLVHFIIKMSFRKRTILKLLYNIGIFLLMLIKHF